MNTPTVSYTVKPGSPLPSAAIQMAAEERPLSGENRDKAEQYFKRLRHNLRVLYIPEVAVACLAVYLVGRFADPQGVGAAFGWYAGSLALVAAVFAYIRTLFARPAKMRSDIDNGICQVYECQVEETKADYGFQSTQMHYRLKLTGMNASILVTDATIEPGRQVTVYRLPGSEMVIRVVVKRNA